MAFADLPVAQRMVLRYALADQNRLVERQGKTDYYEFATGGDEAWLEEARQELLRAAGLGER
jgi:hypothetical protein